MASEPTATAPARSPWQRFYAGVLHSRRRWYRSRAARLPRPVISIGNLHWGGGGKTPLTIAVAAHLRDRRHRVAILSRGYGSRGNGVRIVGTGEGPLLEPEAAGDEPVLMARELRGVAVLVCPDRYRAGLHALAHLESPPDVFVLDDGFSHLRLARDLDVLAFPSADPFAGSALAPRGRLREPLTAAAQADAVVLTSASPPAGRQLADHLRAAGFGGPGFSSATVASRARLESGEPLDPAARVHLVSAIARPAAFGRLAREAGFEIVGELNLPDHHAYPEATLMTLRRLYDERRIDAILTTSKDFVKLRGRLDLPLAELPIEAEPEPAFWDWLDERVAALVVEP